MNLRIWVMGHAVSRATGKLAFSFGSVKSHRFRVQALASFQYCSIHAKVHQNLARYLPRNKTCQSGGILRKSRCQGGGAVAGTVRVRVSARFDFEGTYTISKSRLELSSVHVLGLLYLGLGVHVHESTKK
jgi:hypothetical protein